MLASPLLPTPAPSGSEDRDTAQYRPAKDMESFKQLLPAPVEFVEGSSSGSLVIGEGKYQPINASPKQSKPESTDSPNEQSSLAPVEPSKPSHPSTGPAVSLFKGSIDLSWPIGAIKGCGLNNIGNTCFLNSALQCLLHTPPLLRLLSAHKDCRKKGPFCMTCSMRTLMEECYHKKHPITPYQIANNLQHIAKHLRKGRQEDSHEFLRYAIDALQKSCLFGLPPKLDPKIAETTWVHKLFGGRLRSRVHCLSCGYNSDTFDSILDLSVDIYGVTSLTDALRKFVAVDHLKGADKYKCDKCKKHVAADKQFTVHEAPAVLSVHLKRFSPMGRKIGHPVRYDERISLQPVMSQGQHGPTYNLYGVISHAGGGPNSGHYYAHVKDSKGTWFEMNDESVTKVTNPPTSLRNAYILFYIRDKGQALQAALSAPAIIAPRTPMISGMKKRKIVESDDEGEPPTPPSSTPGRFIGPRLPSPPPMKLASSPEAKKLKTALADPQATLLKKKIANASSGALSVLSQYNEDDEGGDDVGEKVDKADVDMEVDPAQEEPTEDADGNPSKSAGSEDGPPPPPPSSPPPPSTPKRPQPPAPSTSKGVPGASFYATLPPKATKRKDTKNEEGNEEGKSQGVDTEDSEWARTPLSTLAGSGVPSRKSDRVILGGNPFNRMSKSNNLRDNRDSSIKKKPFVTNRYGNTRRRGFAI